MTKTLLNLKREMDIQIYEAQMFPNRINAKKTVWRYIIIKLPNVKDKEFESIKRKATCHIQETHQRTIRRFLSRNCTGQEIVR